MNPATNSPAIARIHKAMAEIPAATHGAGNGGAQHNPPLAHRHILDRGTAGPQWIADQIAKAER